MPRDNDITRRETLTATDGGPLLAASEPDRRSLVKGAVATVAALGMPLLGACTGPTPEQSPTASATATQAPTDNEVITRYAQPEQVEASITQNEALFSTLADIGVFTGEGKAGGLQVSAVTIDGEERPEQRLYVDTGFGALSIVISPEGAPFGPHAYVVTDQEKMAGAPFDWPTEKETELRDDRTLFKITPDGWAAPEFDDVEYIELVTELCGTPMECRGPTSGCAWINCCGKIERTGNCPNKGDVFTENEPCEADDVCEKYCWEFNRECHCIRKLTEYCSS